jgi:hypothetical protein
MDAVAEVVVEEEEIAEETTEDIAGKFKSDLCVYLGKWPIYNIYVEV